MRMAEPAKNSWSPGPWLWRPATRTILAALESVGCFSSGTPDWSNGSGVAAWSSHGLSAAQAAKQRRDARNDMAVASPGERESGRGDIWSMIRRWGMPGKRIGGKGSGG